MLHTKAKKEKKGKLFKGVSLKRNNEIF